MFNVQEMTLVIDSYSNLSFILKDVFDIQEMAQIIDSYSFFSYYLFRLYLCFQNGVNFCTFVLRLLYYLSILFLAYLYFNC